MVGELGAAHGLNRARATRSVFLVSWNRTKWQWLKGSWILEKRFPSNFENKLFFKNSSCGPVVMSYK